MTDAGAHRATLSFDAPDERRARLVADAVGVEVGEIDDDRSRAAVRREGATVVVDVAAADLVALRAAVNTWTGLVGTAERLVAVAGDDGPDADGDDGSRPRSGRDVPGSDPDADTDVDSGPDGA